MYKNLSNYVVDCWIALSGNAMTQESKSRYSALKTQNGFTLVELAIVIVIIGLLLGGVLQGQELIKQAQVRNNVKRIQEISSAIATFYGKYNNLPGDMPIARANAFLAVSGGDGNGQLEWNGIADSQFFWLHLTAAKMLNVVKNDNTTFTAASYSRFAKFRNDRGGSGNTMPGMMYASTTDIYSTIFGTEGINIGNAITLSTMLPTGVAQYAAFTADETRIMDEKIDDGNAITGKFRGANARAAGTYALTTCNNSGVYVNDSSNMLCRILYEFGF
jgi:prepilin-type N-terminal cleavage/methylation domain-containing protein